MEQTSNLKLPFIMPSQAQKHVTHNEALQSLDALVQLAVLDRHLAAPPVSPADGDRYIVAASPTGAWIGKTGQITIWQDGAWEFCAPKSGWLAWIVDEQRLFAFVGGNWIDAVVQGLNPAAMLGVNTTADTTNRLAIKSPAVLFDNAGTDHRVKVNKGASGDTASVLFQTGYSGRAEFGLTGDDDWHVKVSPDGSVWKEALKVNRADGRVLLPAGLPLTDQDQAVARRHIREALAANRTYYVRTDGSNANTGLANTAGGAFLTIQKALDGIATIDFNGFSVTLQIGDGTYTGAATVPICVGQSGASNLVIQGNAGTPGNVIISTTSAACFTTNRGALCTIKDMELRTTTAGSCIRSLGLIWYTNVRFGACANAHVSAEIGGQTYCYGPTFIVGGAQAHWKTSAGSSVGDAGQMITLTGTPAFSVGFAWADQCGSMQVNTNTFVGAATGPRYVITLNAVVQTFGGGASYLPGSTAGTTSTGGQYA